MNVERLKSIFKQSVDEKRVFHAYIIEEAQRGTAAEAVRFFIDILMRSDENKSSRGGTGKESVNFHDDVLWISNEKSVLTSDSYDIQSHLAKRSFSGKHRVAVVENAETMIKQAQDKLLKTLEEPPEQSVIILITKSADSLLQTVISRCITYTLTEYDGLDSIGKRDFGSVNDFLVAVLGNKPFYMTSKMADAFLTSPESAEDFLGQMKILTRDMMLSGKLDAKTSSVIIECAETAEQDIRAKLKMSNVIRNMILTIEMKRQLR